jgi:hypothetical protein
LQNQIGNSGKSSTASKWLIGCGIGCGVVIIIAILVGVGGYFFIKNIVSGFEETEAIMDRLTERYGKIGDFCPDPDGAIRGERLKVFLAVRDSTIQVRERLERAMNILSERRGEGQFEKEPPPNVLTRIKTGIELVPMIAEFIKTRTQALLDEGMGIGEYYYLYVITYYSWLGKSPVDGPPFEISDEDDEHKGIVWRVRGGERLEERLDLILRRLNRQILPMLHNQYEKLVEGGVQRAKEQWWNILEAEIKALESDHFRLPWQDGLPEVLKASLEPYREPLEKSYSMLMNPIELIHRGD